MQHGLLIGFEGVIARLGRHVHELLFIDELHACEVGDRLVHREGEVLVFARNVTEQIPVSRGGFAEAVFVFGGLFRRKRFVSDFDLHGIRLVHEIEVHAHVVVDARSCAYGIEDLVFYLIEGSRGAAVEVLHELHVVGAVGAEGRRADRKRVVPGRQFLIDPVAVQTRHVRIGRGLGERGFVCGFIGAGAVGVLLGNLFDHADVGLFRQVEIVRPIFVIVLPREVVLRAVACGIAGCDVVKVGFP